MYVNQHSLQYFKHVTVDLIAIYHSDQGKDSKSSFATINQFYQTTNDKVEEALASMGHTNRVALPMPAEILPSPNANKASPTFRHLMLPPTSRHFDRDEYFEYLDSVLHPAVKKKQFPSVILYGTEGVGKSTIASTYIVKRYEEKVYDVVLWICAENHTTLRQSFTEIATRLGLKGANSKTPDENFSLVQQWFGTTGKFVPSEARNTQLSGIIILKLQLNRVRVARGL